MRLDIAVTGAVDSPAAYGIVDTLKDVPTQLNDAIRLFLSKVGSILEHTLQDVSSLEVRTYVSDNIEQALWAVHTDMVTRAQANRAEMIKTAVSAASTLLETLKPV